MQYCLVWKMIPSRKRTLADISRNDLLKSIVDGASSIRLAAVLLHMLFLKPFRGVAESKYIIPTIATREETALRGFFCSSRADRG